MKKLLLSSFAAHTIQLVERLLPKPASELRAAYIPTAGDLYENKDFISLDRAALEALGMEVLDIDLKSVCGAELAAVLDTVDVVLVAGGNTFYLLDWVRRSGFDTCIKKRIAEGLVYIGSSAGSILCCPTIAGALRFDPPEAAPQLVEYSGLGCVDFVIIPHAQKEKYAQRIAETTAELEEKGRQVMCLRDDQAVIVEGDSWEVVTVNTKATLP